MGHRYTKLVVDEITGEQVVICLDCGAHGVDEENVEHYRSCEPGSSQRWEEFYAREGYDPMFN
jgi:hypothetical protein